MSFWNLIKFLVAHIRATKAFRAWEKTDVFSQDYFPRMERWEVLSKKSRSQFSNLTLAQKDWALKYLYD